MSNFSKENYAKLLASEKCTKIEQEWGKYKNSQKMTNGDKIRAMSDEELAVLVRTVMISAECPNPGADCKNCFFREPCFNAREWRGKEMEWLKQPANG